MSKNILETRVVRGYTINVFADPEPPKPDEYTDQPDQPVQLIANHDAFVHGKDCRWHKMNELYDTYCEDEAWVIAVLKVCYEGTKLYRAPSTDALDHTSRHRAFIAVNKEEFIKYAMVPAEKHGDAELIQKEIEAYNWDALIDGVIAEWNMYLGGEVLAFEVIDVNGRVLENLYGYYGTVDDVMKEAKACVPAYETPVKTEVYVWQSPGLTVDGVLLLEQVPNFYTYEFASAEDAEAYREKHGPSQELWLCKVTTTPLELYRSKKEA